MDELSARAKQQIKATADSYNVTPIQLVVAGLVFLFLLPVVLTLLPFLLVPACVCFLFLLVLKPSPPAESFDVFFKTWFLDQYMPTAGEIHRERERQKAAAKKARQGPVAGMATNLMTGLHNRLQEATEDVSNAVLYELALKKCLQHKKRWDFSAGFWTGGQTSVRLWQVNLGTAEKPAWYMFLGVLGAWVWLPVVRVGRQGRWAVDAVYAAKEAGDWMAEVDEE